MINYDTTLNACIDTPSDIDNYHFDALENEDWIISILSEGIGSNLSSYYLELYQFLEFYVCLQ